MTARRKFARTKATARQRPSGKGENPEVEAWFGKLDHPQKETIEQPALAQAGVGRDRIQHQAPRTAGQQSGLRRIENSLPGRPHELDLYRPDGTAKRMPMEKPPRSAEEDWEPFIGARRTEPAYLHVP